MDAETDRWAEAKETAWNEAVSRWPGFHRLPYEHQFRVQRIALGYLTRRATSLTDNWLRTKDWLGRGTDQDHELPAVVVEGITNQIRETPIDAIIAEWVTDDQT